MEPDRAARALAASSSSMTRGDDVAGALAAVLENCRTGLDVEAGGILIESPDLHRLELLVASSHEVRELEIHQITLSEGPCIEAYRSGEPVHEHTSDAVTARWPGFAAAMQVAGFSSVHATPLSLDGAVFGAMGLFRRAPMAFTQQECAVAQAFADITTMLVLHLGEMTAEQLSARLREALTGRIVLEQAKGVLAETRDISMAEAYDVLVAESRVHGRPLVDWAHEIVEQMRTER